MTVLEKLRPGLIALIVLSSIARVYVCFAYNPLDHLFSDPGWHWKDGHRFFHPNYIGAGDPMGYQFFLYSVCSLFGDGRFVAAAMNALLSISMPYVFYRAALCSGMPASNALLVWALIAGNPSLMFIYEFTMTETLLLVVMGAALWSTFRTIRHPSLNAWLLCLLLWCVTILTKGTVLPLALFSCGYLWWKTSRQIKWLLYGAMLIVLMVVPNSIRTYQKLGYVAPLGSSWIVRVQHESNARIIGINVGAEHYSFSSPSANMSPLAPFTFWRMDRARTPSRIDVDVDPRRGDRDWVMADARARPAWPLYFGELSENIILFLFSPSWPDSGLQSWDGILNFWCRWLWAPLIFVIIECNLRQSASGRIDLIPLATTLFIFFLMFQNVATMEGRYRKPLEPLLLLNLCWNLRRDETSKGRGRAHGIPQASPRASPRLSPSTAGIARPPAVEYE